MASLKRMFMCDSDFLGEREFSRLKSKPKKHERDLQF
jgi:hypothetical protein